jgi:hypothetical protein
MTRPRRAGTALLLSTIVAVATLTAPATGAAEPPSRLDGQSAGRLPTGALALGPRDLPESRTVERLQPGVTLTVVRRGAADPALTWTLEVRIPATASAPDPAAPPRALSDLASARPRLPGSARRVWRPASSRSPYRVRPTSRPGRSVTAFESAAGRPGPRQRRRSGS